MSTTKDSEIDRIALLISRIATGLILIGAIALALYLKEKNIALLVWIGIGGMMAATAAPMFLGVLWRRATKEGALAGFLVGGFIFSFLHAGYFEPSIFDETAFVSIASWLGAQADNPYACATLGAFGSISIMVIVSLMTTPPSDEHLIKVFGKQ